MVTKSEKNSRSYHVHPLSLPSSASSPTRPDIAASRSAVTDPSLESEEPRQEFADIFDGSGGRGNKNPAGSEGLATEPKAASDARDGAVEDDTSVRTKEGGHDPSPQRREMAITRAGRAARQSDHTGETVTPAGSFGEVGPGRSLNRAKGQPSLIPSAENSSKQYDASATGSIDRVIRPDSQPCDAHKATAASEINSVAVPSTNAQPSSQELDETGRPPAPPALGPRQTFTHPAAAQRNPIDALTIRQTADPTRSPRAEPPPFPVQETVEDLKPDNVQTAFPLQTASPRETFAAEVTGASQTAAANGGKVDVSLQKNSPPVSALDAASMPGSLLRTPTAALPEAVSLDATPSAPSSHPRAHPNMTISANARTRSESAPHPTTAATAGNGDGTHTLKQGIIPPGLQSADSALSSACIPPQSSAGTKSPSLTTSILADMQPATRTTLSHIRSEPAQQNTQTFIPHSAGAKEDHPLPATNRDIPAQPPQTSALIPQFYAPAAPLRGTVPAAGAQTPDILESASEMRLYPSEPALSQNWESISPQFHHSATATRPPLPPQVAAQLIEVVRQLPNRPVDIALSPEELGRVRLSITTQEAGITVNILAERPETLELLRRHIDQLGQEFRDLGFADVAFAFAAGDPAAGGSDPRDPPSGQHEIPVSLPLMEPDTASALPPLAAGALTGLDLRL